MTWDESSFTLFPTSGRVCVWRTPKKACDTECLVLTVKHGSWSVMIWAAISWYSAGPIINLRCRIAANDYVDILGNQTHPLIPTFFPKMLHFFKITIRPYMQPQLFSLRWRSMKIHFNTFPGQHHHQTWISSNQYGQFLRAHWEAVSLRHHLSSNWKTFFVKRGTVFHWRVRKTYMSLFQEGYKLYLRKMVAQLPINKELCIFHNCFHYFVHPL